MLLKEDVLRCWALWLSMCMGLLNLQAQERGATILENRSQIRISKVHILNSPHRETNISITPDGRYLFFMSMRGGQNWSTKYQEFRNDSVFDGDIWYSEKVNGRWKKPVCMPPGINTRDGEDEPNISVDGNTVYFQSWSDDFRYMGGPYYQARRNGTQWIADSKRGMGGGITEFFRFYKATDGMTISPDQKLFIVAAGTDYEGPMDIYTSKLSQYGWTFCQKLTSISTPGDERSVFLAGDGKTLYFASDGYKGYGGLDIYKTTINADGSFGEVINLGPPFNTPKDDYGFILTVDGNEAYFIRDGDIHFADLTQADQKIKPELPKASIVLRGKVRDNKSWKGVPASILLLDARTKRVAKKINVPRSGFYSVELPNANRIYDEIVISEGYNKAKRRIEVRSSAKDEVYTSDFILGKINPTPPPLAENEKVELPPKVQPRPQLPEKKEEITEATQPEPEKKPESKPEPIDTPAEKPEASAGDNPVQDSEQKPELPKPEKEPVIEEDPYSFDGVAENNLVLLLDVSASMRKPDKLPLLKDALSNLLVHLRPEDQISVIAYSGEAKVVIEGISASSRMLIMDAVESLRSGGSTKGKNALRKAYRVLDDTFLDQGNNRIILATDGYFDVEDLYKQVDKVQQRNVSLTVFSFGKLTQRKEKELALLAEKGNGNYANITSENVETALLREAKAVRRNSK